MPAVESNRFFRRRRYLLDKPFQFQMLVLTLGYIIFFALAISVTLFLPPVMVLLSRDPDSVRAAESTIQLVYLHQRLWPVLFMSLFAFGLHSIYTTHKMAGPLYRIRRTLETIKTGKIPKPIHLRKGDFFQGEADLLNETLGVISTRVSEMNAIHDGLVDGIAECREALREGRTEEAGRLLEALQEKGRSSRATSRLEFER
jgi:hypothetical protein